MGAANNHRAGERCVMNESPVLIHVWEIDPQQEDAAVRSLDEMFTGLTSDPGFVSARVLGSPDQTSIAAVMESKTVEDRRRLETSPAVSETLRSLHGSANIVTRMYHEVGSYRA